MSHIPIDYPYVSYPYVLYPYGLSLCLISLLTIPMSCIPIDHPYVSYPMFCQTHLMLSFSFYFESFGNGSVVAIR